VGILQLIHAFPPSLLHGLFFSSSQWSFLLLPPLPLLLPCSFFYFFPLLLLLLLFENVWQQSKNSRSSLSSDTQIWRFQIPFFFLAWASEYIGIPFSLFSVGQNATTSSKFDASCVLTLIYSCFMRSNPNLIIDQFFATVPARMHHHHPITYFIPNSLNTCFFTVVLSIKAFDRLYYACNLNFHIASEHDCSSWCASFGSCFWVTQKCQSMTLHPTPFDHHMHSLLLLFSIFHTEAMLVNMFIHIFSFACCRGFLSSFELQHEIIYVSGKAMAHVNLS
jgi:hypothetical protein